MQKQIRIRHPAKLVLEAKEEDIIDLLDKGIALAEHE